MTKYRYTSEVVDKVIKEIEFILENIDGAEKHDIIIHFPFLSSIMVNNIDAEIKRRNVLLVRVNKENYVDKITSLLTSEEMSDKLTYYIDTYLTEVGKEKIKKIIEVEEN